MDEFASGPSSAIQLEDEFRQLSAAAEVVDLRTLDIDEPHAAYAFGAHQAETILFRGDGLARLRQLTRSLTTHALLGDGLRADTARNWLASACHIALSTGDVDSGWESIAARLREPAHTWIASIATSDRVGMDLTIGRASLTINWPSHLEQFVDGAPPDDTITFNRLLRPLYNFEVSGRDAESAVTIAMDRLDELRSVLAIGHAGRIRQERPAVALWRSDEPDNLTSQGTVRSRLFLIDHSDPRAGWYPGLAELAAAAGRADGQRTEWERRVISAARWMLAAQETRWYSQSLSSLMIAFECLFVPKGHGPNKGKRLAERASAIRVLPWFDQADQVEWLTRMYRRRNDVAHEGIAINEDLDVEDLIVLGSELLPWAIWHLDEGHSSNGVCGSMADVEDTERHEASVR